MTKMLVELEWNDEELGEKWKDIDDVKLYLWTSSYANKGYLKVREIRPSEEEK